MSNYVEGWYWHPENAGRDGRLFKKEDGETVESLAARGWVDSPSKIGMDVWGGDDAMFEKKARDVKEGFLPAIEETGRSTEDIVRDAVDRALSEKTLENQKLFERIRQLESAQKQASMNDERLQDEKSDAKTQPKPAAGTRRRKLQSKTEAS